MSEKEKNILEIDVINNLSSLIETKYYQCVPIIERLQKHKEPFIRQELAVLLSEHINDHSIGVLKDLACDKNYLVQVEALDSLMGVSGEGIKDIIIQRMGSVHPLVRGYAYRCLSEYSEEASVIRQHLQVVKEKNTWARIELFISEARVRASERIQKLIRMYPKCNYLNRCAISNGITDIFRSLSREDQDLIKWFVKNYNNSTDSAAEKEAFSRLLRTCEKREKFPPF